MKKLILLAMSLCASTAFSQALPYVPMKVGLYTSVTGAAGSWSALVSSGSATIANVPEPTAAYCSTDGTGNAGTWVPCVFTGGGAVTSVFGRTGVVVATTGDYTAAKVTNALDLSNASTQTMSGNLALPAGSSFSANIYRDVSGTSIFTSASGKATFGLVLTVPLLATTTNCSSAASPAVCAAAPSGSVVIAAAATSVVVNTTAVTANSQILIQHDSSLGTRLTVTCNTTLAPPQVTARTAATSFTISTAVAPTTNPACYSYTIVN